MFIGLTAALPAAAQNDVPGRPEVIPFWNANSGFNGFHTYYLVKWEEPEVTYGYYFIATTDETLKGGTDYTGSEGRFLHDNHLKGGSNRVYRLKVCGSNSIVCKSDYSQATGAAAVRSTVSASAVTHDGATLTVSNLPARWWYKGEQSGATCTAVSNDSRASSTSATITGLDSETSYTYHIYYRDTCTEDADKADHWDVQATFTTTSESATLTSSAIGATGATLTIGGHTGNWHYKHTTPSDGTCSTAVSTTATTVSDLTANTSYTFVAYSDTECSNRLATAAAFPTLPPKPAKPTATRAGSGKNTRSHMVGTLSNGTIYKFKVLAVNANGDGAESAESGEATASNPEVSAEDVTATAATITLAGYSGTWSHKPQSGGSCTAVNSGNSSRVTQLNSATTYNYSVYVGTDCTGDSLGGVSFTTKDSSSTGNDVSDDDDRPVGTVDFTPGLRAVPLFLSASDSLRQSFVRVINTGSADTARIFAFDDTGQRYGPVTLSLRSGGARHFNSTDLELGKPEKGLPEGIGGGMGDWRLLFDSDQPLEVLSYVRGRDGFVTSMHEVAPADDDGIHSIHFLNPASNWRQESRLRLINWEATSAVVEIRGWDDAGEAGDATVVIALGAREARTLTAKELEAAGLGDGDGKWRLEVEPRGQGRITAMSLLESPTGHLSNLSAANGTAVLPLFLSAADAPDRQGFARIINHTPDPVTARLSASDDSSWTYEPVSLGLAALGAAQFNSQDFEHGNPDKGLSAGVGTGQGHWRIRVTGSIGLLPLAYSRAGDGFVTGLNRPAPMTAEGSGESHRVAFFNPGSNWRQVSLLWLANPGERTADVRIAATDDLGRRHGSSVALRLPPGGTRMLRSDNLEAGDEGFEGAFGDGVGKWRLDVRSTQPITVMSLLESPTDYRHLSNLSTVPSKALILPTRYAEPY